jgi:hypothetical protein
MYGHGVDEPRASQRTPACPRCGQRRIDDPLLEEARHLVACRDRLRTAASDEDRGYFGRAVRASIVRMAALARELWRELGPRPAEPATPLRTGRAAASTDGEPALPEPRWEPPLPECAPLFSLRWPRAASRAPALPVDDSPDRWAGPRPLRFFELGAQLLVERAAAPRPSRFEVPGRPHGRACACAECCSWADSRR